MKFLKKNVVKDLNLFKEKQFQKFPKKNIYLLIMNFNNIKKNRLTNK